MPHPMPELRRSGLAAYVSAGVLLVAGSATLTLVERGALSELMVQHLLVMNVVAPVLGAPRELYGLASLAFSICTAGPSTLADQQLAGLMMIVACPLSYIVAGLIMATQMLARLELRSARRTDVIFGATS